MPHQEKCETQYYLRSHPRPVPRVTHVHDESCLLYKLVEMKNKLATSHKLIFDKIVNRTIIQMSTTILSVMLLFYCQIIDTIFYIHYFGYVG